jgi:hypothetical protein
MVLARDLFIASELLLARIARAQRARSIPPNAVVRSIAVCPRRPRLDFSFRAAVEKQVHAELKSSHAISLNSAGRTLIETLNQIEKFAGCSVCENPRSLKARD